MSGPLLRTKLYLPGPRSAAQLVPRPRLIERLNDGLDGKLTLVSAPAGFGKTTLLSEWAAGCGPRTRVAWVSLDTGDNDPSRFWAYVVAALQSVCEDFGEGIHVSQSRPPPIETILSGLINEMVGISGRFALVLDDFHMITAPQVHDGFSFLLDNLPPSLHLFLSTRADPPWPLARLRARGEMTELRADDLRFSHQEAATFLNGVMGLHLSPENVAELEARTEGWVAGLQLAALSMQGREDIAAFIKAFGGSHRFILDYLVEEVLERQSNDIQEFLLETSILERMTASLCDAVTDRDDGQAILPRLDQANLFIVPLDDERRWYRYHHLFADLLRSRLEQTQPEQVPALHRQASKWYEQNGLIYEAVTHALAAGDAERVGRLIAGNALTMIYHGQLTTLLGCLEALPDDIVRSRPWLCVAYAWALAYSGQLDAVKPVLQAAETALAGLEATGEIRRVTGHVAAIRAYSADLRGEYSHAAELAREALERLPDEDLMIRGFALSLLGTALRDSGDLVAATLASTEAVTISLAAGDVRVAVTALCELAILLIWQGQLRRAATHSRDALQLADGFAGQSGQQLPATGLAYARLSSVLREWNDLEAATHYARKAVELCEQWGQADISIVGYSCLARALQATGDSDGALNAIQRMRQIASAVSPYYGALAAVWEAQLQLAQGDTAAARWARESGLSVDDEANLDVESAYRTIARILIAQGEFDPALRLLARLLKASETAGAIGYAIEIQVLQAMAHHARGEGDKALPILERALSLAEPEGYVRTFIDEGEPMGQLLRQAAARGIAVGYVGKLLAALEQETEDRHRLGRAVPGSMVEPLSERELEVLRLLTTHLSSTEIARELIISVNTVRSHIKSIYSKLDVHSREDAVQRAEKLDLL